MLVRLRSLARALLGNIKRPPISAIVLAMYFALATLITFPFIVSPLNTLTAPVASDFTSSVTVYGAYIHERANPFTATNLKSVAEPDGISNNAGVNRVSFLSVSYLLLASYIIGPIAAHSLEAFLGLLLTAFVMFLFARAVTKSAVAGFVAGLAYGFWPLMLGLSRAEPTYTHMWLYILPMWAFWELARQRVDYRRIFLAAASILPALFWTPYFAFHISLVGASCGLAALWYVARRYGVKKMLIVAGCIIGVWVAAYVAYYIIGNTGPASDMPARTVAEAYQQSAHPLMYLFPGETSTWGKGANELLTRLVPSAAHTSLYVGLSILLLAIISLSLLRKNPDNKTYNSVHIAVSIGLAVTVCSFLFSLAPTVVLAGHTIPTPNDLVVKLVPALRAGQRLAMPLMGALTLLASVGIWRILSQRSVRLQYLLAAIITGVVVVDLWAPYANSSTRVVVPPSITRLSRLPQGLVAQYQAESLVGYPAEIFCLEQFSHHMPIINDCGLARPANAPALPPPHLAALITLPLCQQLPALKTLNVRYLIVPNDNSHVLQCISLADSRPALLFSDSSYQIFQL